MQFKGIGSKRALAIADHFGTWDRFAGAAAWEHKQVLGAAAKGITPDLLAAGPAGPVLPDGVRMLCQFDAEWPARLTRIPDPPALLWVVGAPLPDGGVAIVGTRQPTEYGTMVARMVAAGAADRALPTVSGLALGVDTIAHEACMDAGVPTWAVLGQGVDTLHEGERADLARRIVAAGGGLVAEVPPGTATEPHQLIRRNRLQSALADAVVVAQSGVPGPGYPAGTMHTARYAVAFLIAVGFWYLLLWYLGVESAKSFPKGLAIAVGSAAAIGVVALLMNAAEQKKKEAAQI
jgi:DNA processing protein